MSSADLPAGVRLEFDPDLPITAWREEIAAAIAAHPVVVVAGETGSGKTTQLPKICLQLGRRSIAHTQPRRIAARSVAERIAGELDVALGDLVGYQVRFTRQAGRDTRLKVMTDGVLLNEIGRDRDLRRYDTIIIDEAHERSLNIDFLLGYLRRLTERRRDLKVIITSATIDTERFAAHFADAAGNPAPVIEVSGRTYPVEVRYRPVLVDGEVDQLAGITAGVTELSALGGGDILVFLSGEREIRDAAQAITGMNLRSTEVLPLYARLSAAEQQRVFSSHPGRRVVLATNVAETSLTVPGIRYVIDTGTARISRYSARTKVQRLPIEPISQASANQRAGRCGRVAPGVCIRLYDEEDFASRPEFTEPEILRTNLASVLLQMAAAELGPMESFPFVQPPDRSSINDGRRLLEELGALQGARLTKLGRRLAQLPVDPRIGRMLLAGEKYGCLREVLVIAAGLSIQDPRERPAEHREAADALHRRFWAPIDTRSPSLSKGDRGLSAIGPSTGSGRAETGSGRGATRSLSLSKGDPGLPAIGPSTGSGRVSTGSGRDPSTSSGNAGDGDFVAWVRLWDYLREQQRERSGNGFRRMCREEFLHFLRIREWQDLHAQLRGICAELGLARNSAAAPLGEVHTAVLTGLLSHVGLAEITEPVKGARARGRKPPREYLGARGTRFAINPGSSVARVNPPLVMAAEIVETTRLWARTVAEITAEQIESVGSHLLKRTYSEPHWSSRAASVQAYETVTLYGVPIVSGRRVGYGRIDPAQAREIFIRSALVENLWRTRHAFHAANTAVRAEAEELQERTRRRDLVVDDQVIFDFYDARIPADIVSGAHFDSWWKQARDGDPDLLTLGLDDLVVAERLSESEAFPDEIVIGSGNAAHRLPLRYRFEPGDPRDGVSVLVPLALVTQLDPAPFGWLVPGLRTELATELLRSLPKAVRRRFVPAAEYADRALDWLAERGSGSPGSGAEALPDALARALLALTGERVDPTTFDPAALPRHLRPTFVVTETGDPDGEVIAEGSNLAALQQQLAGEVSETLAKTAREHTRTGATDWVFGTIAEELQLGPSTEPVLSLSKGSGRGSSKGSGRAVIGYPALADEQVSVGLTVVDTPERQRRVHAAGLRRLVLLQTPDPTRWTVSHLSNADKLALGAGPYASVPALLADVRLATIGELIRRVGPGKVSTEERFRRLCDAVRPDAPDLMRSSTALVAEIIRLAGATQSRLAEVGRREPAAAADLTEQLGNLVFRGFVSATPYEQLAEFPRFLRAAGIRIDTLLANPARDHAGFEIVARCEDAYAALCDRQPPGPLPEPVAEVGWQLEELRVSLFAQSLRTRHPVSEKRVLAAIRALG